MEFSKLQPGTLLRRYKRFLADVELPGGEVVTAHCPNTGAMTGCADPGVSVWLSHSDNPKRKLAWTLELVESGDGLVCVHSALANRLVEEALERGLPAALAGFEQLQREVKYGAGSRADFQLRYQQKPDKEQLAYIEVKAVTLHTGGCLGQFPDAVSDRARRHVEELQAAVAEGHRAAMVFCVLHSGIERVSPNARIDPAYAAAMTAAVAAGVEVYALGTQVTPAGMTVVAELPVVGL